MDDALTTFTIVVVGLSGGLLSDAYSYMKIMLSSVVVEHCRLLGSKCAGGSLAFVGCGILLEMEHWKCYWICW